MDDITLADIIFGLFGLIGGIFGGYQYLMRKKNKRQEKLIELEAEKEFKDNELVLVEKTAAGMYCAALREELGCIMVAGSPDIDCNAVKLDATFVPLDISRSWRSDDRFAAGKEMEAGDSERRLTPEEVMTRAFEDYRLLLIIGDPGSGKTTLLKYYAMKCLDKKHRLFGFDEEILPIYFPLRELDFNEKDEPLTLPVNLERWAAKHMLDISTKQFASWLQKRRTLILLDGLDEISSKKRRRKVCAWIKHMCAGLSNARFVVTSRATGYRKLDGIELDFRHLRADIMDFSLEQQEDFLKKWFRAVYLSGPLPVDKSETEWRRRQVKRADLRSGKIVKFLRKKENKAVQELAAVPMLLQITALIWKERRHLPKTRPALFDAALNYLLDYRDREKEIEPLIPAEEARLVLAPSALWMQEELKKDEALKEEMHKKMQPILTTLQERPPALEFCEYLRDRAGLLADYDPEHYVFRHKSFREYLSALQLREDHHLPGRIETLVEHFNEDWWEEPLRFFMSRADDEIFDRFMNLLFRSEVSFSLDANRKTLLENLVREAPQKRIDSLKQRLLEKDAQPGQVPIALR
ncbi:MAG: NACHT domain-containing protein [Candidatus Aminicenantes bacterium]|nr:NACHT domain-containing protein [Candidatus Aminicenantes bacterium]